MDAARRAQPGLRLVGLEPGDAVASTPARVERTADRPPGREAMDRARRAVKAETRLASTVSEAQVRTVFAGIVASRLQGGRAAILPGDARERLLDAAKRFGLRPFDATLIIALVQDSARRGAPLDRDAQALLAGGPWSSTDRAGGADRRVRFAVAFATGAIAVALFGALVAWVNAALNA